jgi:hypothetical protein
VYSTEEIEVDRGYNTFKLRTPNSYMMMLVLSTTPLHYILLPRYYIIINTILIQSSAVLLLTANKTKLFWGEETKREERDRR